ncbi:hypothetical protein Tco_0424487 [Tanacetum coccineum]
MGDRPAQTRFERLSKQSNDPPLSRFNTLGSRDDSMKLNELMEICTKLSERALALENIKTDQDLEITNLKKRGRYGHDEVTIASVPSDVDVSAASPTRPVDDSTTDDIALAETLMKIKSSALRSQKDKGVMFKEPSEPTTTSRPQPHISAKDKGKGIMQEPEKPVKVKGKDQFEYDADLQAQEREELTVEEQSKLLAEFIETRRKYFAAKRAKENKNKPPIKTQQRCLMCTYLKHMKGYKHKDFKGKSFDAIKKMFDKACKRVNTFVAIDSEVVESSRKKDESNRKKPESSRKKAVSKKRVGDDSVVNIESLATKYPIVDWKTHILVEDKMYYQIIRADESTKYYKIFNAMLDGFDKQDVLDLYSYGTVLASCQQSTLCIRKYYVGELSFCAGSELGSELTFLAGSKLRTNELDTSELKTSDELSTLFQRVTTSELQLFKVNDIFAKWSVDKFPYNLVDQTDEVPSCMIQSMQNQPWHLLRISNDLFLMDDHFCPTLCERRYVDRNDSLLHELEFDVLNECSIEGIPQKNKGTLAALSIIRAASTRVRFRLSTTPFCSGVRAVDVSCLVPSFAKCFVFGPEEVSPDKERYNADIWATNILLQGLLKEIYTLINHYTDEKDIWDNVKMLLEGSELNKEDRESQLYDDFEHFRQNKGETIHDYYIRFAKLINDMWNIKMTMSRMQLNSKFVNNMLPEWGRFVTAVKLNRGLRDSNYDQLYTYLKQHEAYANEKKIMLDGFTQHTVDPLALMSNVSHQHYYSQSSTTPPSTYVPPYFADNTQLDSGLSPTDNLIENLTNTLALLTQSYKTIDRIEDRGTMHGVQVQLVMGEHKTELGMLIQVKQGRLSATTATNGVALDEEQLLFIACGQDYTIDEDVDEQPVRELTLNVDNVFQADDCDAFDSDVDEAPMAHTMFMANLSPADPVYAEVGPSYDSGILSEEQVELYERRARLELMQREQKIDEQLRIVITDRNIKEENLKKELHSVKMQLASTINHNKLMVEEVTSLKKDFKQKENKYLEKILDMKALKEKVKDKLYKLDQSLQTIHMLCKPKPCYNEQNKVAIGYKNLLCLTRAKKVQPALYNGYEIIKTNHVPALVHNTEDTLEIAEITRRKMKDPECVTHKVKIAPPDYLKENYLASFTPQKQLTPEQIFWSQDLIKMKE